MEKILYFEGAGCVERNDVPNCRIRTAFTNDKGKKIYLELMGLEKAILETSGSCSFCFQITNDPAIDDCNTMRIRGCSRTVEFPYTMKGILDFVNRHCDASFTKIIVLDNLAGYRVHNDKGKYGTFSAYNYADEFEYDAALTQKRIDAVSKFSADFLKKTKEKYDNTSYFVDSGNLIVRLNISDRKLEKFGFSEREFILTV